MEKAVFERSAGEGFEMLVSELIVFLVNLQNEQPDGSGPLTFKVWQGGDHWDGYGVAEIEVVREETPQEAAEREKQEAITHEEYQRSRLAHARAEYERLKAQFGGDA